VNPGIIKRSTVFFHIVVRVTQTPSQAIQLQCGNFIPAGMLNRIKHIRGWWRNVHGVSPVFVV